MTNPSTSTPANEDTPHGLAAFFGLRRGIVTLLAMLVLVGLGEKLFQRFLPLYLTALGAGPLAIGLLGFTENGMGALYALPGGRLTDRLGHRRSLALFAVLNLAGYALLAVPWWPVALVALLLCTAWSQLSLPATLSLVARQLPTGKRVMGLAVQGIVRRIPMAIGPVVGGAVLTAVGVVAGMRWLLAGAAVLTIVALVVQLSFGSQDGPESESAGTFLQVWRGFRPELRRLLLSDILVRFCEQMPAAFVVLWVVDHLGRSNEEFGLLTAVEMIVAASLYIPVAWWVDRHVMRSRTHGGAGEPHLPATERGPFIVATFVMFSMFPIALLFSSGWWSLVAAFAVRGLKEFGEPARKATIADLARDGAKASSVGVYYFIRDSLAACAALLGGVIWKFSPTATLLTACGCGLLGTALYFAGTTVSRRNAATA